MSQLKKNVLLNLAGSITPALAGLLFTPYIYQHLDAEQFGILTLIWAIIGYFSLFDMGAGRALTYKLSRSINLPQKQIAQIVSSGIFFTILLGSLGALFVIIIANNSLISVLNFSPTISDDALLAFKICSIGALITTINRGIIGIYEGLNMFKFSNVNKSFVGIIMFGAPALAINFNFSSLWQITLTLIFFRFLVIIFALSTLRKYLTTRGVFKIGIYKSLIQYGGWITVSGIIGPLMIYGDRFLVSSALSPETLPFYAIPQEILQRLLVIPTAFASALFPHFTKLKSSSQFLAYYRSSLSKILRIMLPICIILILVYRPVASIVMSPDFSSKTFYIFTIISIGILINSVALIPYTAIHSMGLPKVTAILHFAEIIIYLPLLFFFTYRIGILGAGIVWTSRVAIDFILLSIFVNFHLKRSIH